MRASLSTPLVRALLDRFAVRAVAATDHFGDDFPDYYDCAAERWWLNGGWTKGFWPGLLWRLFAYSGNARLAAQARRSTRLIARLKKDVDDHDLGFLFRPSCVLEHEVCGTTEMLPAAIAAAQRLAARYLPDGQYIPAHGAVPGSDSDFAIIDTVMNFELLLWAARYSGDRRFETIAVETARTIKRERVRSDGSSCQVIRLDPATGRTVCRAAVMAVRVDSCWARGQAWGVQGFARVHEMTGLTEFRTAAMAMAEYFLSRLPADSVVFHDLDDPGAPHVPKDSSAQAIAAGGMLLLARASEASERSYWRASAERLLGPLVEHCIVEAKPGLVPPRGFLGQAYKSLRKNQGVVSEIVFGDCYFVDALQRWLALQR